MLHTNPRMEAASILVGCSLHGHMGRFLRQCCPLPASAPCVTCGWFLQRLPSAKWSGGRSGFCSRVQQFVSQGVNVSVNILVVCYQIESDTNFVSGKMVGSAQAECVQGVVALLSVVVGHRCSCDGFSAEKDVACRPCRTPTPLAIHPFLSVSNDLVLFVTDIVYTIADGVGLCNATARRD